MYILVKFVTNMTKYGSSRLDETSYTKELSVQLIAECSSEGLLKVVFACRSCRKK